MKHSVPVCLVCALGLATARAFTEQEVVNADAKIIREFRRIPEQGIPESVLNHARGLAIIKVLKVGFGVSGKGGEALSLPGRSTAGRAHPSSAPAGPALDFRSGRK